MPVWLSLVLRMFAASLCGFAIGYERKSRSKEAGIRTHSIVALGAALIMIVSKYAMWETDRAGDGLRIAAQIVSGIGFLGAGMIIYSKGSLHGLTTAAGIWATAGIGMAIGAGGTLLLIVGVAAALLILGLHLFLHIPIRLFAAKGNHSIQIQYRDDPGAADKIKALFKAKRLLRMKMLSTDAGRAVSVIIRIERVPTAEEWRQILNENDFITSLEYYEEEW
ncbi:MAG: MgtC/SapB family protein [Clostridiales bacterium]|nr:MgtC/SapB family protein [Clostridiales bacterium]